MTVARGERHRPGHGRPARQHGGELRLQLHDRRRARLRRPGRDEDPRRPGQRAREPDRRHRRHDRGRRRRRLPGAPAEFGGFYLQEEAADADANPATSEGIFVFSTASAPTSRPGDLVRVRGTVAEFNGADRDRHGRTRARSARPATAPAADAGPAAGRERRRLRALRGHARQLQPDADRHRGLQPRPLRRGRLSGAGRLYTADRDHDAGRRRDRAGRSTTAAGSSSTTATTSRTSTRRATRRAASRRRTRSASATRCRG